MTTDKISLNAVDIVFIIDTTASMGPYIDEAKARVRDILKDFQTKQNLDIKVSLIEYRDHPPQDYSFVTREYDFTDVSSIQNHLNSLIPAGGGDRQEAVWPAINKLNELSWRQNSDRQVFIILDSPPHGYGTGDGFPQGDPSGLTQDKVLQTLKNLNIEFNAHSIAGYQDTTLAIKPLVDATNGKISTGNLAQDGTKLYTTKLDEVCMTIYNATEFYNNVISGYGSYTLDNCSSYASSKGMCAQVMSSNVDYLAKRGIKTDDEQESNW